jgi:3-hydroxyacyl-[acyl-carrier-protein] dehydratase
MSSKSIATVLDFEQIKGIIPQRFPFLMIDRVIEAVAGERVVAIKNLTGNEWFYQGHFPKRAVTPGAMIGEAVAQTGIVFFSLTQPKLRDVTFLLGAIKMRFRRPAWPGDQLRIEVTPIRLTATAAMLNGVVSVGDQEIARGEFALAAKPNSEL